MYRQMIHYFSRLGLKYLPDYSEMLKDVIAKSNLEIIYETYIGKMLFISSLSFICIFLFISVGFAVVGVSLLFALISGLIGASTSFFIFMTLFYYYPIHILTYEKNSIESNLPFAVSHMAAIASSGVPPFMILKLLSSVPEYGEITNIAKRITRNVDIFGMDVITSIKNVALRTPSEELREFLYGFIATITTGGSMKKFLENSSKDMMFNYRLKRQRYIRTLSVYADIYTAMLIAAPLFFISILSIMSLIGGNVFGISIPNAMNLGTYIVIPLLNIIFIMFIHYTQPTM